MKITFERLGDVLTFIGEDDTFEVSPSRSLLYLVTSEALALRDALNEALGGEVVAKFEGKGFPLVTARCAFEFHDAVEERCHIVFFEKGVVFFHPGCEPKPASNSPTTEAIDKLFCAGATMPPPERQPDVWADLLKGANHPRPVEVTAEIPPSPKPDAHLWKIPLQMWWADNQRAVTEIAFFALIAFTFVSAVYVIAMGWLN